MKSLLPVVKKVAKFSWKVFGLVMDASQESVAKEEKKLEDAARMYGCDKTNISSVFGYTPYDEEQ
jgi:adenine deaminase